MDPLRGDLFVGSLSSGSGFQTSQASLKLEFDFFLLFYYLADFLFKFLDLIEIELLVQLAIEHTG